MAGKEMPQAFAPVSQRRCWERGKKGSQRNREVPHARESTNEPPAKQRLNNQVWAEGVTLEGVRAEIVRQEDSVIFSLAERARLPINPGAYEPGAAFREDGEGVSLVEFLLRETEWAQGKARRYTAPDEHPFFPEQRPLLAVPPLRSGRALAPGADGVNVNRELLEAYTTEVLPALCEAGEDGNHGSAAAADVACLQALSRRVHLGKFVAEAKFRESPQWLSSLARKTDRHGIWEAITDPPAEERALARVRRKASNFGELLADDGSRSGQFALHPEVAEWTFRHIIVPLTKEAQV